MLRLPKLASVKVKLFEWGNKVKCGGCQADDPATVERIPLEID